MQPSHRQTFVQSSLLDRLLDDEPQRQSEPQVETLYDVARYKQSVARDLESLLNSRCVILTDDSFESFPQAKDSLLGYGITDLSSLSLLNPDDRMFLRDSICRAIERHEPRLAKVRVNLDISKELTRVLLFRVDALLKVHPNRPPVSFDAILHLASNSYQVKN